MLNSQKIHIIGRTNITKGNGNSGFSSLWFCQTRFQTKSIYTQYAVFCLKFDSADSEKTWSEIWIFKISNSNEMKVNWEAILIYRKILSNQNYEHNFFVINSLKTLFKVISPNCRNNGILLPSQCCKMKNLLLMEKYFLKSSL